MATVGRSGRITYVAKLEPTSLSGSIISSATLHNATYIMDNDIRINDIVSIFKAGEIIPKVIGPILTKRPQNTIPFKPIQYCPICHTLLEKQDGEVDQYCTNISCPSRIIQSLIHFCSKAAMNIDDLSEGTLQKLFDAKIITRISDIYLLDKYKQQILESDFKIKEKSFTNIWNNIQQSKHNSLERLIIGLGIRHVGETTAKVLAKAFRSLDQLKSLSIEDLAKINDIGQTVAISIVDYFHNQQNLTLINELKNLGVNITYLSQVDESKIDKSNIYYQKNFVITGSFEIARHEIKKLLEAKYDANVSDAITRNTNYLIVGENGGSKIDKATKYGITIIKDKI
jgi:DNA ligase (NAD+)